MDTNTLITLHDGLETMMAQGLADYYHISIDRHRNGVENIRVSIEKDYQWVVYHSDTKEHEIDADGWGYYPLDDILSKCYEIVEATTAKGEF